MSEQVIVPIAIRNDDDVTDEQVLREYTKLIEVGFKPKNVVHLGKRGSSPGFLKEIILGQNNVTWFRQEYSEENWGELVEGAKKEAHSKAFEIFARRSNVRGAREEMERILSARAANAEYFGLTDEGIEDLRKHRKLFYVQSSGQSWSWNRLRLPGW